MYREKYTTFSLRWLRYKKVEIFIIIILIVGYQQIM